MLRILSVSASLLNLLLTLTVFLSRKVIFKLNLALKQWLVCRNFSAITLSQTPIHSLKKYSLIFLLVFTLVSSITLLTNTPRMMNQSVLSTHLFLQFILTTQPVFLKSFYIFLVFVCNSKFLLRGQAQDGKKRPPAENDLRPAPALGRLLDLPEANSNSYFFQLQLELLGSPRTH